jgi:hypothetical protein
MPCGTTQPPKLDGKKVIMGFLKSLFGGGTPAKPDKRFYIFHVKCNRCGEIIEGRVDLDNDLSLNDEGDGFIVRKGLIGGTNRCFQQVNVEMTFNSERELLEKTVQGGTFVES